MNKKCKGFNKRLFMNRILTKFKDRWYFFVFIVVLAVTISLFSTLLSVLNSSVKENKYYEATSKIYIDWQDDIDFVTNELEANMNPEEFSRTYTEKYEDYVKSLIQQWQKKKVAAIMTDCNDFIGSNQFRSSVNELLVAEGYGGINGTDVISLSSTGTAHLFTVTVVGYGNKDRVSYLAELTVQNILNTGSELFGLEDASVVDDVDVYKVAKSVSSSGKAIYTRVQEYPDNTMSDPYKVNVVETIFSYRNLKIIVYSMIGGVLFIILLALADTNVANEYQAGEIIDADYIGKLIATQRNSYSVLGATIAARAKNTNIEDIIILSPTKEVSPYVIEKLISCVDQTMVSIASATAITDDMNTIISTSKSQGIILLVSGKYDTFRQLKSVMEKIEIIKGNMIGFVFCELPYYKKVENKKTKIKRAVHTKSKVEDTENVNDDGDELDLL